MGNLVYASLALAMCLVTTTAHGQTVIEESVSIDGDIDEKSPKNQWNQLVSYFLVSSPRGTQWDIVMSGSPSLDPFLMIRSTDCRTDSKLLKTNDDGGSGISARLRFVSGGGAYCMMAIGANSTQGSFKIIATKLPQISNTGFLIPGVELMAWERPNWTPITASTTPTANSAGRKPLTVFRDCEDVCPEMVVLPSGKFLMGSPAEEEGHEAAEGPRHTVSFASPFAVGRYEVTFAEYDACVSDGGCPHKANDMGWGRSRRPVVDVSWNDAQSYVTWLSQKTQQKYNLLSESEWEYAARAGTTTPWNTGSALVSDDANILDSFKQTVPVGGFPANAFGLHDMHGNVFEWVADCVEVGYFGAPVDGHAVNRVGCKRVLRGGSFPDQPVRNRSAYRTAQPITDRIRNGGFRISRSL